MGQDQTIFRHYVIKKETPLFILRKKEASYSIEAAVSFSIFMFIFVTALIYIRLITAQYVIKESMVLSARKAAAFGDNIEKGYSVYQLMIGIQPYNLQLACNSRLELTELEVARATFIRNNLPQIV